MNRERPLTVSEITNLIKRQLEGAFPSVAIQGEVSNFKVQSSGHIYFTLKDSEAQLTCAMFRGNASRLKGMPKEGDQVIATGEINVYAPRGNYQLIVRDLIPIGVGQLLLKFQQLKAKLEALGWFNKERKKPLPPMPKRIGVVTSPTGAVIQDIIHVLNRRVGNYQLLLNPVKVQGPGAEIEIAKAVRDFNKYKLVDVIILGRGGGSFEDLFCFSEEIVAKAIFESEIPIISAVGHETDFSIADFVADLRAPTPTAAAEMVMGEKIVLKNQLNKMGQLLSQALLHKISYMKQSLKYFTQHPLMRSSVILNTKLQLLDDLQNQLDQTIQHKLQEAKMRLMSFKRESTALNPKNRLLMQKNELMRLKKSLPEAMHRIIKSKKESLERVETTLKAIDPNHLLKKGYAILFSQKEKSVITTISKLHIGEAITAKLADGEAQLEVKSR